MDRKTHSVSSDFWRSERDWFDRNRRASGSSVGHRKAAIWRALLWHVPRDIAVLEVGTGEGTQLAMLDRLGFSDLSGCDVNQTALSRNPYRCTTCVAGSLPYCSDSFDLVITSGLLIHIEPQRLWSVMAELARVSSRWIAGYEYHAAVPTPIVWHGQHGLLWKADYPDYYRQLRLKLAKLWLLPHIDGSGNVDSAFLLTK